MADGVTVIIDVIANKLPYQIAFHYTSVFPLPTPSISRKLCGLLFVEILAFPLALSATNRGTFTAVDYLLSLRPLEIIAPRPII
jgi:hypothetical protein